MSDHVSSPKTPSDNIVRKIGRVQFSADSVQFVKWVNQLKWHVLEHMVMFMFCADINVSTCHMYVWPHASGELRNVSNW